MLIIVIEFLNCIFGIIIKLGENKIWDSLYIVLKLEV